MKYWLIAHLALAALLASTLSAALLAAAHHVVVLDGLVGVLNSSLERAKAVADADAETSRQPLVLAPASVVALAGVALHGVELARVEEVVGT